MLKRILILAIVIVISTFGFSQYVLKTPDGKTVKLHENGKWEYVNNTTNPDSKKTSSISRAKYLTKNKRYVISYDPNQWVIDTIKATKEYWWDGTIYSQDYAVTANWIDSRLSMPADDSSARIMFDELGVVKSFTPFKDAINGLAFTGYDVDLEFNGLNYTYKYYVHSDSRGSIQFLVGTQKEVFEEDREKILNLIQGINKYKE